MGRQRVIVGIGEAMLCEYPDRIEPGGLSLRTALSARLLGHRGVPISRLGQDLAANELLTQLKGSGINVDHLQSDPDLPTGRLVVRSIAGTTRKTLTTRAAFDNLQWDFDLVDIAQQADAVMYGMLAQREGQSRSIIRRFLAECTSALRVCDLTNRDGDTIDRGLLIASLESADVAIADHITLKAVAAGWDGKQVEQAIESLRRVSDVNVVLAVDGEKSRTMVANVDGKNSIAPRSFAVEHHEAAMMGFTHGLLNGWDVERSLQLGLAVTEHAVTKPDAPMPSALLD